MRAAAIVEHGRPPQVVNREEPVPAPGTAQVAVHAAPITPLDVLCASGGSYFGAPALPYVPGVQGVGIVRNADRLTPGRRVWFPTSAGMAPGDGSMAEVVSVPENSLVELPDEQVSDAEVAALGLSAVAAWMCLTSRARLRPGEQVLVLGAGGVVGQVAVQAARILGAGRVVAAARSAAAQERAARCGAEVVVPLEDAEEVDALAARLAEACGGTVDVVVDPLCGTPASAAARVLGEGARMVNLGSAAGPTATFDSAVLRSRSASVLGYTNTALTPSERDGALLEVLRHAAQGRIRVDHEVVPLADVTDAWHRQASGTADRRIVVDLS